jgi:hypothetical protein
VFSATGTVESAFDASGVRRVRVERPATGATRKTYFLDAWSEVEDGKLARFIVHGGKRIARLAATNGVATEAAVGSTQGALVSGERSASAPSAFEKTLLFFASNGVALALLAALLARYRRVVLRATTAFAPPRSRSPL